MKRMKSTLIALVLLFSATGLFAQGMEFQHGTVDEVLQMAKSSNKLVFVDCFTDWCGPCKWMAANTFPDKKVGEFFNANFVNYKLDMEKGEGVEFAKKYNIRAYPTLLFLDGDGEVVHVGLGGQPAEAFLALAEIAMDPNRNLRGMTAKFESGARGKEFLSEYLMAQSTAGMDYQKVVEAWMEKVKPKDLVHETNWDVFVKIFQRVDTEYFQYAVKHYKDLAAAHGEAQVAGKLLGNYQRALMAALAKGETDQANALKSEMKNSGIPGAEKAILSMEMRVAQRNEDWKSFTQIAEDLATNHAGDDWSLLNSIAWTYYEQIDDKDELKKAAGWAKKSTEIDANYYNLDTYGMLLKKIGDKKGAIEQLEKAVKAAKKSGDDPAATQEVIDELKG